VFTVDHPVVVGQPLIEHSCRVCTTAEQETDKNESSEVIGSVMEFHTSVASVCLDGASCIRVNAYSSSLQRRLSQIDESFTVTGLTTQ